MHPIHQQRSPPQLLHGIKSHRPPTPRATEINKTQNHHDPSAPRQKKIRTRMQEVIRPIHSRPPAIQRQSPAKRRHSRQRQHQKSQFLTPLRKIRKQPKSHRQSHTRELRPPKYRTQPHLRHIKNVHAIHIRFHLPGQNSRPPSSPQRRRHDRHHPSR